MKSLIYCLATAVCVGLVGAPAGSAADSPSVLLQKGIFAEETEGNLEAAIKIYEQIATESAVNRSVAAQAQYRLAVCYQKKGNKEQAIKVLNELVQQFPSDAAMIQKARGTLTELGAPTTEAVSVRRIPLPVATNVWIMSVSEDGRLVAYESQQPKDRFDLVVYEVTTGKTWIVGKPARTGASEHESQFSPDAQWIASQFSMTAITLAKVDVSEARELYVGDKEKEYLSLRGWSLDGKHVVVESWDLTTRLAKDKDKYPPDTLTNSLLFALDVKSGAKREIARVAEVEGKSEQYTLVGEPGFVWDDNRISPDGRYMARREWNYPRKLTLLDMKSGREDTVVSNSVSRTFGWFAGDRRLLYNDTQLLYTIHSAAALDLMSVGIKDGKPSGEPRLIWSFSEPVSPFAISRDGHIYYTTPGNNPWGGDNNLWVMEGFLTRKTAFNRNTSIPPEEILGPNDSFFDQKLGLAVTPPAGWKINNALRMPDGGKNIVFTAPEAPRLFPQMVYHGPWEPAPDSYPEKLKLLFGPKPPAANEVDSWLRQYAQVVAELKKESKGQRITDYKIRPDSMMSRTIGGHKALSWSSNFTRQETTQEKNWVEFKTFIFSENLRCMFTLAAPAENMDAVRPAFERMIETVRWP
jgi:hypothetical protein